MSLPFCTTKDRVAVTFLTVFIVRDSPALGHLEQTHNVENDGTVGDR